jgi:hypothetical protein
LLRFGAVVGDSQALCGDRRAHLRFDATGVLWASLHISSPAILHNISALGARLEATLPRFMPSIRAVELQLGGRLPAISAVVRYITPTPHEFRYVIGVEFVHLTDTTRFVLEQFVESLQR